VRSALPSGQSKNKLRTKFGDNDVPEWTSWHEELKSWAPAGIKSGSAGQGDAFSRWFPTRKQPNSLHSTLLNSSPQQTLVAMNSFSVVSSIRSWRSSLRKIGPIRI